MSIESIEIQNIKGFDRTKFSLQLVPNKPNLLVAPNGFGKSSIATAFASMNSKRMTLAEKDHHKEDKNHPPELSIKFNGQTLTTNANQNEIQERFDVTVIRSGLIPTAKRTFKGGVSASMGIESIWIRKIPQKVGFNYQTSTLRANFGANGKILPNIGNLLSNPTLPNVILECDFSKFNQKRVKTKVAAIVTKINGQSGSADSIIKWVEGNLLDELRAIRPLADLASGLVRLNLASSEVDSFLVAHQLAELFRGDHKSFRVATNWLSYLWEKDFYSCLIDSFCSSDWQWAKLTEDKKHKALVVTFPQAHQISNGQRDVLTMVVQMHRMLYEGLRKPLILVIDEVFDYLDDANLVAFQYYTSSLIEKYKDLDVEIYPLILTHLDPGVFFDFCFNRHKIRVHYLNATSSGKCKDMLKLIEARESNALTETLKQGLDEYWFHFNPNTSEFPDNDWPPSLKTEWRKSKSFHKYTLDELARYLEGENFDALAVCIAVRVRIERRVYELLVSDEQRMQFVSTHKTKEKLNFASAHIPSIPETYFLLGLIHNANLHWKQGKDFVTPLATKLGHPTIKNLIAELF